MRLSSFARVLILLASVSQAQQSTPAHPFNEADLPQTGMVYALDPASKDDQLHQIHATEIVSNSHAGGNLLRAQVYMNQHSSVGLKGLNAPINFNGTGTVFYVRINSDDPDLMRTRIHLLHLAQSKDRRVVADFSHNVFGGGHTKKYDEVAITKTDVQHDVWIKITPTTPLAPGEYGVVFMPKDVNLIPTEVYDFDILIDAAKPEKK